MADETIVRQINVQELKSRMDRNEDFLLIDVREKFEREICRIENSLWIPLNDLISNSSNELNRLTNSDKDKKIIAYCHHGGRSEMAVDFLVLKGYTNAKSLIGGIDSWAKEVDRNVAVY